MIRIFQMGEVEEDKIFARTKDTTDVSAPVRAGTLVQMARENGWRPNPAGAALDCRDCSCSCRRCSSCFSRSIFSDSFRAFS